MLKTEKMTIVALSGLVLITLSLPSVFSWFTPVPYRVTSEVISVWEEDHVDLVSGFYKEDHSFGVCDLVTFTVSGVSAGVPKDLQIVDLGGLPPNYSRPEGAHEFNVRVLTSGKYYESITIHTRHLCGDIYVNREYATIRNPREE